MIRHFLTKLYAIMFEKTTQKQAIKLIKKAKWINMKKNKNIVELIIYVDESNGK